jgi:uncharacterized protein (DUF58 family)
VTHAAPLVPAAVRSRGRPRGRAGVAFGRRTFVLLGFGLIWIIPAFADSRFIAGMFAWDVLVLLAWLFDLGRLPRADRLTLTRTWLAPASLGVPSDVEISLMNDSASPVHARVLDAMPRELRTEPPTVRLEAAPGQEARAAYTIEPVMRGDTPVGAAHLRYQTPLRLAERWATADLAQTIRTYPNIAEAKRHSIFLVRSRQIDMEKRASRARGRGRAFESLREYQVGDELRDVCWTASGRRGRLVTRLYEIERSQTIWALLDSGRLMRARAAGQSKLDHAVNAALALAQVALGSGDRVGVLAYGRTIAQRLPAARGSAHLKRILDQLAQVREDEWEADHLMAASRLLTDQKRRSLIVWITDLAETAMTPEVVRAATRLMRRHVVLFVVIGEPDLQAMARHQPDTVPEMFETAAAQEVVHRRETLLAKLREGGAMAIETDAGGLSLAVVNGYLDVKQRNRV